MVKKRKGRRLHERFAVRLAFAAALVLTNVLSLASVGPFTAIGPQPASAQVAPCPAPLGLINGGFEEPEMSDAVEYFPEVDVPGWLTDEPTDIIEYWQSGSNPRGYTAYEGGSVCRAQLRGEHATLSRSRHFHSRRSND